MNNTLRGALGLCMLLLAGMPPPSHGATAWDLISPKSFDPHSRSERLAIARDLQRRVAQFANLLDNQSPAEIQTLEKKEAQLHAIGGGDNRERAELQLSVAYQHRRLAAQLNDIGTALDCVIDTTRVAAEMSCWATTSLLLSDEETLRLALSTLRSHHRLPRNKDLPALVRSPEIWYETYGRGILQVILVPYLRTAAAAAD